MKYYIAGPMRGVKLFGFPAFDAARDRLVAEGHTVISPADLDRAVGFDPTVNQLQAERPPSEEFIAGAMKRDIEAVMTVDALYALAGWEKSVGATAEVAMAKWRGIPITYQMPSASAVRKASPLARGCLDYFPAALLAVAQLSLAGNEKHNPREPLHHARGKSSDHADCILRHLIDRGTIDPEDGISHTVKVAWRALALLQEELESRGAPMARGAK